ncbi:MAG: spore coat U domain-containing protein [Rhodopila sp.]|nr:spore coat U domain-containing protein [Rhodopila sp.]
MKRIIGLVMFMLFAPTAESWAQCSVGVGAPVSFGTYLPLAAIRQTSVGSLTVGCSSFTGSYTISFDVGLYSGGSFSNRRMSSGSDDLLYQLYTDAAYTTVWGDGSGGTVTVSGSCVGTCSASYNVYGQVPARQPASPGTYTDAITVTISF